MSDDSNNGEEVKPAPTKILENAGRLLATGDWEALNKLASVVDNPTPAVLLARALAAFHLDRKADCTRLCREILEKEHGAHLDALSRYYLASSLDEAEALTELRKWAELAPNTDFSAALKDATPQNISKLQDFIDAIPHDEDTVWLKNTTRKEESGCGTCRYCSLTFNDKNDLRAHIQTDEHQKVLMSDEGKDSQ